MAIWEKLFNKITFKDYPDTTTPLNASNMNTLSNAIDGIDDRVVELNSNLEWKLIARVEGSNPINLAPYKNIAREFRFVAVYEYGNTHWKVPITASYTDVYDDSLYQYLYGGAGYGNANGVGASIGIDAGGGNVILKDFYFNGNIELGVATALFAYYR